MTMTSWNKLSTNGLAGLVVALLLLGFSAVGNPAAAALASSDNPFAGMAKVGDQELDNMRGGFTRGGFRFRFGVEILRRINGEDRVRYSFTSEDLTRGTPPPGVEITDHGVTQVTQVGDGNSAVSFDDFSGVLTLVQNTRDNVNIQNISKITVDTFNTAVISSRLATTINNLSYQLTLGF